MRNVRQDSADHFRRWFFDDDFDLIVWYKPGGALFGFQLCYDKAGHEKALTWKRLGGLSHATIDTGDQSPWFNRTPILMADNGRLETARLLSSFKRSAKGLPVELRTLVVRKIKQYGRLKRSRTRRWPTAVWFVLFGIGYLGVDAIRHNSEPSSE